MSPSFVSSDSFLSFLLAWFLVGSVAVASGCAESGIDENGDDSDATSGRDTEVEPSRDAGEDAAAKNLDAADSVGDAIEDSDAAADGDGVRDGSDDVVSDADASPCGGCGPGEACTDAGCVDPCLQRGLQCGEIRVGGEDFTCGSCGSGNFCEDNACRSICQSAGADCGAIFWGGQTTDCGPCSGSASCFHNRCVFSGYRSIDGGYRHTCATDAGGDVYCWGKDSEEELGNGSSGPSKTPVSIAVTGRALEVRSANLHSCVTLASGEMNCWGLNNNGQVGDRSSDLRVDAPSRVDQLTRSADPGVGNIHSCAVLDSGDLKCWGAQIFGRLGNGDSSQEAKRSPVDVENLSNGVEVAAGGSHTCALDTNGEVWCWGNGSQGRLGNGRFSGSAEPVKVDKLDGIVDIAAGADHNCAVRRDGEVWCWGHGGDHQLGNGQTGNKAVPVRTKNIGNAVAVVAGEVHTCARTSADEVLCWGTNASYDGSGNRTSGGQLGTGDFQNAKTPEPVVGPGGASRLSDVVAIGAGAEHTCAVQSSGDAYCWGNNAFGQLGDGGTSHQNEPVKVQ